MTAADISEQVAALAVQGPTSARLLRQAAEADIDSLKYFRVTTGRIAGVPVEISRTGYTGDLGYEIWLPWDRALDVWDRIIEVGKAFDARPAGMGSRSRLIDTVSIDILSPLQCGSRKSTRTRDQRTDRWWMPWRMTSAPVACVLATASLRNAIWRHRSA